MEIETKKEQVAADQLLLIEAIAHLEDMECVNQTGSLLIPPSKHEHCRELYTKAAEIQQRFQNVVHDKSGKDHMLANLQTSMQGRCRGVKDWNSVVAPEGFKFHESQYVSNVDSSRPTKREKKSSFDTNSTRGLKVSLHKGETWCKEVKQSADRYADSRELRYA